MAGVAVLRGRCLRQPGCISLVATMHLCLLVVARGGGRQCSCHNASGVYVRLQVSVVSPPQGVHGTRCSAVARVALVWRSSFTPLLSSLPGLSPPWNQPLITTFVHTLRTHSFVDDVGVVSHPPAATLDFPLSQDPQTYKQYQRHNFAAQVSMWGAVDTVFGCCVFSLRWSVCWGFDLT